MGVISWVALGVWLVFRLSLVSVDARIVGCSDWWMGSGEAEGLRSAGVSLWARGAGACESVAGTGLCAASVNTVSEKKPLCVKELERTTGRRRMVATTNSAGTHEWGRCKMEWQRVNMQFDVCRKRYQRDAYSH